MKLSKREIRPVLFARIAPVEQHIKPDRLKHKLDSLDIFCTEQGYKVLGRCGSIALQDATYPELEQLLLTVKRMKERPKPNALIIKDWNDFPDHVMDSAQLIMKCKSFGLAVFTMQQLLCKGDEVETGFDEEG